MKYKLILFILFIMLVQNISFSQVKLQNVNSQLGMNYYNLLKYHGKPVETFYEKGYKIIVYNIEIDFDIINNLYSEYFGDSYSFLILKNNIVIGNVIKLYMHDYEILTSFFESSKQKRNREYQKQPFHETPIYAGWKIYSSELNATLMEIIMMVFDPKFKQNTFWAVIGTSKEEDFNKLTLILESDTFSKK